MTKPPNTSPTPPKFDFATILEDLDGGVFAQKLSRAVANVAAGTVDYSRKGKVVLELNIAQIGQGQQVNVTHKLRYEQPTLRGKLIEEDTTSTPLWVGRAGTLTFLPDAQGAFDFDTTTGEVVR